MINKKIALFMVFMGLNAATVHGMENNSNQMRALLTSIMNKGNNLSPQPFMATQKKLFKSKLAELHNATSGILTGEYPSNTANLNKILAVINDCEDILSVFLGADPSHIVPFYALQVIRPLLAELEELRTMVEARKSNQ
jgi:hypothetical protein